MAKTNGHPLANACANRGGNAIRLSAGVTLKAVDSLVDRDQQHFTREQVAYLIHLAFLSGAEHRRAFDHAELIAAWDANTTPKETRQARIAREIRQYAEQEGMRRVYQADKSPARDVVDPVQPTGIDDYGHIVPAGQTPDPNCEWPEVAQPGRPELRVAA